MNSPSTSLAPNISFRSIFAQADEIVLTPLLDGISTRSDRRDQIQDAVIFSSVALFIIGLVLRPRVGLVAVLGCGVLWVVALVFQEMIQGRINRMMVCWAAFFPLGYFLLVPRERAILTFERMVVLAAFIALLFVRRSSLIVLPRALRDTGIACLAFTGVACASLANSTDLLNPLRSIVDSFLLPLLFVWCVVAIFDVRQRLPAIHTAVCISSVLSAGVAAGEIVTGEDILPIGNSVMYYTAGIARPNGPFSSNDVLSLIGAVSFFLLLFLKRAIGPKPGAGRNMLHFVGLTGALGMALMPMFRSVAIALVVILLIDTVWERGVGRRTLRVALLCTFVAAIFSISVFAPQLFEDRSDTSNLYGRFAQYMQSFRVFVDHPWLGVGFLNFHNFVNRDLRYITAYEGVTSLDWPHSNAAQVLTETGIAGFIPWLMIQVLFVRAVYQLSGILRPGRLAWKYSLYMFLTYWIAGLTESSGFDFVNIWFAFAIAVPYKFALTEPCFAHPAEAQLGAATPVRQARFSTLGITDAQAT